MDAEYKLQFELSEKQKEISKELINSFEDGVDTLVYAACGSGKTEIVLEVIRHCLEHQKVVGISIPRRQVVLELQKRLGEYFQNIEVIAVCEGYTDVLSGDLIICTTHQLFRYHNTFDLLIVDEPDAFPFANNPLLQKLMRNSVRGSLIYLTATPSEDMKLLKTLTLFKRYHGYDLLVPDVVIAPKVILYFRLYQFIPKDSQLMLFVPSIRTAERLSKLMRTPCIHSKTINKEEVLAEFSEKKFKILICTTIMERGITIEGVNICVLFADHVVYSKASLIQIAGRVGRLASSPTGDGLFLCQRKSRKVDECISELKMMNA